MSFLGNILWLVLGGILVALIYYLVGIPFGVQLFKLAISSVFPFGKEIRNLHKLTKKDIFAI